MTLPAGTTIYNKRPLPDTAEALPAFLGRELNIVDRAIKDARVRASRSVTAAFTVTLDDELVRADASAGAFAVTLPAARQAWGRVFQVKNVGASGTVTVTAAGTDLIDGAATYPMATQYQNVTVQSYGTGWDIL